MKKTNVNFSKTVSSYLLIILLLLFNTLSVSSAQVPIYINEIASLGRDGSSGYEISIPPSIFFTQILGLALGMDFEALGLERHADLEKLKMLWRKGN